jgi:hypothetical protein
LGCSVFVLQWRLDRTAGVGQKEELVGRLAGTVRDARRQQLKLVPLANFRGQRLNPSQQRAKFLAYEPAERNLPVEARRIVEDRDQFSEFRGVERLNAVRRIGGESPPDHLRRRRCRDLVEIDGLAGGFWHFDAQRFVRQPEWLEAAGHHDASLALVIGEFQRAPVDEEPLEPRDEAADLDTRDGDLDLRRLEQSRLQRGPLRRKQHRHHRREPGRLRRHVAGDGCDLRRPGRRVHQLFLSRREIVLDFLQPRLEHLRERRAAAVLVVAAGRQREGHDHELAAAGHGRSQGADIPDDGAEEGQTDGEVERRLYERHPHGGPPELDGALSCPPQREDRTQVTASNSPSFDVI